MKKMIKRIREEKGGFTLAELLIVVGILLVLIAIAVPVFSGVLGNAENAVAKANERSVKSEALTKYTLADAAGQTALAEQKFYYNDKGDEVKEGDANVKYAYTVTITKNATTGDVTANVVQTKPAKPGEPGVTE